MPISISPNNSVAHLNSYSATSNITEYSLLFIHERKSWSISKFWDFFNLNLKEQAHLIMAIDKKTVPILGSYFIIIIN